MPTRCANSVETAEAAIAALSSAVEREILRWQRVAGGGAYLRVETPIAPAAPLEWLNAQSDLFPKVFWSDRETGFTIAGAGAAAAFRVDRADAVPGVLEQLRAALQSAQAQSRFFGGARFSLAAGHGPRWTTFGAAQFILPRFEWALRDGRGWFACNLTARELGAGHAERVLEELAQLNPPEPLDSTPPPAPLVRVDRPGYQEWREQVERVLGLIRAGSLTKLVLARESEYTFESGLNPVVLLGQLAANTMHSYHYLLQTGPDHALLGASPERLYRREGARLTSEAVAGTRPRGASEREDLALGDDLLESGKDAREHQLVVDAVREAMEALCEQVDPCGRRALLKLRRCQHLQTRFEGQLRPDVSDLDIIERLHPTPAVGGAPRDAAMGWLQEIETFDRGWYTGPFGWIGRDAAEFAVAIRLGVIDQNALALYAGAGIVPGSAPEEEWAEIENKMSHFSAVLYGDAE